MKKVISLILIALLCIGGYLGYGYYDLNNAATTNNFVAEKGRKIKLMVEKPINFEDLGQFLKNQNVIENKESFNKVLIYKGHQKAVLKPGLLILETDWDNSTLINQIYLSRNKGEVEITFNNVRLKPELAGKICRNVKADSANFLSLLEDTDVCAKYGFNTKTIMTLFLPDTYQLKYETNEEELLARMAKEYKTFWSDENKSKANALGLSQSEVSVLASLVQGEQSRVKEEQATIAGLYINRLNKGMLLQSDPTLVFAVGDFTIKRVLNIHKEVESPYNTYKYTGLPPGPINLPEKHTLQNTLNAAKHDYIFMCAKPKGEGSHNFAKSYNQHLIYARAYQKWVATL